MTGHKIYNLAKKLFPINRSLTGNGVVSTLKELKKINSLIKILYFPSNKKVFDWKVPLEWNIKNAWVKVDGRKIIDFKDHNLSLVGYSIPVNKKINFSELNKHLYSIPKQQNAIPYITSYYNKAWGFCLKHSERVKLDKKKIYHVFVDSELKKGKMHYGEILIPGKSKKEIFFSTYICHPSMANNELSGPTMLIFLSKWIKKLKNRHYSYRIIFIPETIGSIAYLSKNFRNMKKNVVAGYNVTCVGDEGNFSYLPSRNGNTFSDQVAVHVLNKYVKTYNKYLWLNRGSDERQYCSPGINLPVASIMKSKYEKYPEYHTSLDNLENLVSAKGLNESFEIYKKIVLQIENSDFYQQTNYCEPFLTRHGLYPTINQKNQNNKKISLIMNFLSYCDGKNNFIEIVRKCKSTLKELNPIVKELLKKKIIKKNKFPI